MAEQKQTITWDQLVAFAKQIDRETTHVYRVVKGDRESPPIAEAFEKHFGFAMKDAAMAGRRPLGSAA